MDPRSFKASDEWERQLHSDSNHNLWNFFYKLRKKKASNFISFQHV